MDSKRPQPMKEPRKPHGDKIDAVKDANVQKREQVPDDSTARVGGAAYAPHDVEADELAKKGK